MGGRLIILIYLPIIFLLSCGDNYKKKYYDNGQLKSKARVRKGLYDGDFVTFYSDGRLKAKGVWNGGIGNGFIEHYSKEGWIEEKSNWRDNLQHGPTELYYQDGTVRYRGAYERGVKVEEHVLFSKDGGLQERTIYDQGGDIIYLVKFGPSREKVMELVFPVLSIKIEGDSIYIDVRSKIPLAGTAVFSVLKKENDEMLEATKGVIVDHNSVKVLALPFTNVQSLYYRFDYTPGESDTLASFGYNKRLVPVKEKPKELLDFS